MNETRFGSAAMSNCQMFEIFYAVFAVVDTFCLSRNLFLKIKIKHTHIHTVIVTILMVRVIGQTLHIQQKIITAKIITDLSLSTFFLESKIL